MKQSIYEAIAKCARGTCAPRVSCCRRIDDDMLEHPAEETDLEFLGFARPVSMEEGCQ
jgi:hypothetical protein